MRYLALFILLATPATAADIPSRALFAPAGPATVAAPGNSTSPAISNFIYLSPGSWRFTWRGQTVTPVSVPSGLSIRAVTPTRVTFTDGGGEWVFDIGKFR